QRLQAGQELAGTVLAPARHRRELPVVGHPRRPSPARRRHALLAVARQGVPRPRPHPAGPPDLRARRGGPRRRQGPTHHSHPGRSEEHTSELQSREKLVCRLLLEKKNHHSYFIGYKLYMIMQDENVTLVLNRLGRNHTSITG